MRGSGGDTGVTGGEPKAAGGDGRRDRSRFRREKIWPRGIWRRGAGEGTVTDEAFEENLPRMEGLALFNLKTVLAEGGEGGALSETKRQGVRQREKEGQAKRGQEMEPTRIDEGREETEGLGFMPKTVILSEKETFRRGQGEM
ncbi:hypothetical protein GUJ93_ZPchr0012g21626 [Zizania palustris]|uniref:Uncharacterized protein n=1 Tax=Zizania palustris TaxID=103762 RepID=A0A8J6BR36_ZIZPA|nr:hypothetical protein GUJ93_ZPchr0012g21626 [Zizania palustris]